jgi:ABC-type enterochelin transport system permease subunit
VLAQRIRTAAFSNLRGILIRIVLLILSAKVLKLLASSTAIYGTYSHAHSLTPTTLGYASITQLIIHIIIINYIAKKLDTIWSLKNYLKLIAFVSLFAGALQAISFVVLYWATNDKYFWYAIYL